MQNVSLFFFISMYSENIQCLLHDNLMTMHDYLLQVADSYFISFNFYN